MIRPAGAGPVRAVAAALLLLAVFPVAGSPATGGDVPAAVAEPTLRWARSAILIDEATGRVLYERNADEPLPPASLTKLMTLHIVYQKLAERAISRDDVVWYSKLAYAGSQQAGSTVMNLRPGFVVTVEELMKGAAIQSGNDAAVALAEFTAGSVETFVRWMNEESRYLGLSATRWVDPAGAAEGNAVTARELAVFCRQYILQHPESLGELHSLREFQFPQPHNLPEGSATSPGEVAYNHNWLVQGFGVDGLKTGRWDDENFTIAITGTRGADRLVAVLLGVPGRTVTQGSLRRSADAQQLLTWGFASFETMEATVPELPPIRVWKGTAGAVAISPPRAPRLALRPSEAAALTVSVEAADSLVAPVSRGQKVGNLVYRAGGLEVGRFDLVASADVEEAGLLRKARDAILMTFERLFAGARSPSLPVPAG